MTLSLHSYIINLMEFVLASFRSLQSFVKKHWPILLICLLTIPAITDLLKPGFFTMHDDLQVFRLYEVDKCFKDFQIPCRWVPDAGFGYGYPLMQFYPPMPYYPMEILNLMGFGLFWSVKIMFALAFTISGIGMYLLAKKFFGQWGGFFSAILYVYAPYHSVDIYVRGALNEAWGMVWFPFVLLGIYNLVENHKSKKHLAFLGLFLGLQLTSHNVMTMVFAPTAIIWAIFWLISSKNYKAILNLVYSGVLGVSLAAFFFIPVVLEQKYVHVDSMIVGYFNYLAHFADFKQLFLSQFWGYGGSTWGPEDGMSFSVGIMQWIFSFLAGFLALINFKKNKSLSLVIFFSIFSALGYSFLTHSRSVFLWDHIKLLQFSQFPWRLVALAVFYFSFSAGYIFTINISTTQKTLLLAPFIIIVISYNVTFFRVERPLRLTIEEKFSGKLWENQVTGGIFDYLPRTASRPPGDPAFTIPNIIEGKGSVLNFKSGSNWQEFNFRLSTPTAKIMLPLYTYQGLDVYVNGKKVKTEMDADLGRVIIDLNTSSGFVQAKIWLTPVRLLSDILSILSFGFIYYLLRQKNGE